MKLVWFHIHFKTSSKKEGPTLSSFWQFSPHLLDPLQHHVAVTVKSLHPSQQLLVVPETFHEKETIFRTTCSWSRLGCCSWRSPWGPWGARWRTPPAPSPRAPLGSCLLCWPSWSVTLSLWNLVHVAFSWVGYVNNLKLNWEAETSSALRHSFKIYLWLLWTGLKDSRQNNHSNIGTKHPFNLICQWIIYSTDRSTQ